MKILTNQDIQKLGHRIAEIRVSMDKDLEIIKSLYAHINNIKDVRITAISRLHGTFAMTHLSLMFLYKDLLNKAWWGVNITPKTSDTDIQSLAYSFSSYSRMAFIQSTFSSVESSFRLLLRAIDPSACNGGTSSFKSIYECLLKSKLSHYPDESVDLLDLLRLIRNTVHNNGVYFHRAGQDNVVIWQGNTYTFKHENPIDFVNWDFCVTVADNVRKLIQEVVKDSNIRTIEQLIIDPFA